MPFPAATQRSALVDALREERDAFRRFCQLLQAERACLLRADVEALLEVTRRKSEQVDQLAELGSARIRYLGSQGLQPGSTAVEQSRSTPAEQTRTQAPPRDPATATVTQLWRELVEIARTARQMNEANGTLITARLAHNQAALAALRSGARVTSLYGPDGQTDVLAGQRELGSA